MIAVRNQVNAHHDVSLDRPTDSQKPEVSHDTCVVSGLPYKEIAELAYTSQKGFCYRRKAWNAKRFNFFPGTKAVSKGSLDCIEALGQPLSKEDIIANDWEYAFCAVTIS